MLGYVLAEPYWGRGLMTEAAKKFMQYPLRNCGGINRIALRLAQL